MKPLYRAALVLALSMAAVVPAWAAPKKLLVVTATQGFRHSSIGTAERVLESMGEQTGLWTVDFVRGGADGKGSEDVKAKMTAESLKNYDGVIFANTTGDLPLPEPKALIDYVEAGHAFVGMHAASDTFHGFKPYIEMLGGEFLTHGAQATVNCNNDQADHPATAHLGPKFSVHDEIYIMKSFQRDQVHGLLTLDKHPNTGQPGDYPISWSKNIGKGRLFYTSLGHREDVWTSEAYQKHILGGIQWALGLVPAGGAPTSTPSGLSAEEKAAGWKSMFNGQNLSGWHLRRADGTPSWSVQDGILVNTVAEGQHGTDLVGDEKFRDFKVRYEYRVPKGANSGFYLRGRHEIQIYDDYSSGKPAMGGNGGIYNTAPPTLFVSRKAGEWQHAEVTMRGQKVTVFLNGVKVHADADVPKPTGSQLDDNINEPGPFFLQGDHGSVAFRNMRILPLK